MEEVRTDLGEGIRELAPGYIRFSIKANDTKENEQVHEAFKEFCKVECDNNYTQGVKKLLENYDIDYKYESLFEMCQELKERLNKIEAKAKEPKEEETEAF